MDNKSKDCSKGFKSICPNCGGDNLWVQSWKSFAYCFECSSSFVLSDVTGEVEEMFHPKRDKSVVRSIYNVISDFYHESMEEVHFNYLFSRGIDRSAIKRFKLGFCPSFIHPIYSTEPCKSSGVSNPRGQPTLANRITFPYIYMSQVTDIRGRIIGDSSEVRYKSIPGSAISRHAHYGYNEFRALYDYNSDYVVITEGEIKTIIADMFGIPTIGMPGITTIRGSIQSIMKRVIVIFDSSSSLYDNIRVDLAIKRLSEKVSDLYVVTLPVYPGLQKVGLDDFLLYNESSYNLLMQMIGSAVPYSKYKKLRRF